MEIEAFQWRADWETSSFPIWFAVAVGSGIVYYQGGDNPYLTVETPDAMVRAYHGDYIVRGAQGELSVCKADIFQSNYELV